MEIKSWSKWDILLAFGCMDKGKLQKASVTIARMCGITVKMLNRYFWIQVTSITVQDVTLCCTVSSTQYEPGPWRWRHLNSSEQSELLASWHGSTTQKTCICGSITEPNGFTLIHTEIHWNKHVTTVLTKLWYFTCPWLGYPLVNVQMIARFQSQNKPTGIQIRQTMIMADDISLLQTKSHYTISHFPSHFCKHPTYEQHTRHTRFLTLIHKLSVQWPSIKKTL